MKLYHRTTQDGIVIVDQHAAHERLVYERLKHQMAERGVAAQALPIPEIIELSAGDCAILLELADDFGRFGLGIESFEMGRLPCVKPLRFWARSMPRI